MNIYLWFSESTLSLTRTRTATSTAPLPTKTNPETQENKSFPVLPLASPNCLIRLSSRYSHDWTVSKVNKRGQRDCRKLSSAASAPELNQRKALRVHHSSSSPSPSTSSSKPLHKRTTPAHFRRPLSLPKLLEERCSSRLEFWAKGRARNVLHTSLGSPLPPPLHLRISINQRPLYECSGNVNPDLRANCYAKITTWLSARLKRILASSPSRSSSVFCSSFPLISFEIIMLREANLKRAADSKRGYENIGGGKIFVRLYLWMCRCFFSNWTVSPFFM